MFPNSIVISTVGAHITGFTSFHFLANFPVGLFFWPRAIISLNRTSTQVILIAVDPRGGGEVVRW